MLTELVYFWTPGRAPLFSQELCSEITWCPCRRFLFSYKDFTILIPVRPEVVEGIYCDCNLLSGVVIRKSGFTLETTLRLASARLSFFYLLQP